MGHRVPIIKTYGQVTTVFIIPSTFINLINFIRFVHKILKKYEIRTIGKIKGFHIVQSHLNLLLLSSFLEREASFFFVNVKIARFANEKKKKEHMV